MAEGRAGVRPFTIAGVGTVCERTAAVDVHKGAQGVPTYLWHTRQGVKSG